MKFFIFLSIALTSLTTYAGPEEHKDIQICYDRITPAPAEIPEEICIETISIDLDRNEIQIYSYFYAQLLKDMNLLYLARHNENGFSFSAAKLLSTAKSANCDEGQITSLQVSGQADNDGQVRPTDLNITVRVEAMAERCQISEPKLYRYKLR